MKVAPWILLTIAIVALGGALWYAQRLREDRAAALLAQHDAELELLDEQDVTAAMRADSERLDRELREALEGNRTLRDMLARARKAMPTARVTTVERTCTGSTPALIPLWTGDDLDLRVSEITTESDAGTVALVGTAEVWKIAPPPEVLVARGELHGTYVLEPPPDPPEAGLPTWATVVVGGLSFVAGGAIMYRVMR
jgi:hypothetical protein